MYKAHRSELSVYIAGPNLFVEVYHLSFPRFFGSGCTYYSIESWQREKIDEMLRAARRLCDRFNNDKRSVNEEIIKKAFNRDPHYSNECMGPLSATFEHLFMKGDPYRQTPNHSKEKRVVLACYECNHSRGHQWRLLEK